MSLFQDLRLAWRSFTRTPGVTVLAVAILAVCVDGALFLSRVLSSLVFEVSTWDPWTLAMVTLVLTASAVLAAWLPARRAMRVDPVVALRAE